MRKQIRLAALAGAIVAAGSPVPGQVAAHNLRSDQKLAAQFATLALKSLRLMKDYEDAPEQTSPGHVTAARPIIEALGDASDAARSKGEIATVASLKQFLTDKITNNNHREDFIERFWLAWQRAHPGADEEVTTQAKVANRAVVLARPIMIEMTGREAACSTALDEMLRSEVYHPLPACGEVAVSVVQEDQRR